MNKWIGLTIHKIGLFSNGAIQNAFFLSKVWPKHTIQYIAVESDLTHFGLPGQEKPVLCTQDPNFPFEKFQCIITATRIPTKEFLQQCQTYNVAIIKYVCGNNFMFLQEEFSTKSYFYSPEADSQIKTLCSWPPTSTVWAFEGLRSQQCFMETVLLRPVEIVPHLWDASIVEAHGMKPYAGHAGHGTANCSGIPMELLNDESKKAVLIIAESNYSTVKSAFVPLMASERLFLDSPELVGLVYVLSSPAMRKTTSQIVEHLQLHRTNRLRLSPRISIVDATAKLGPSKGPLVFVSHCTFNDMNYMHYELLYHGYALVHNSKYLKDHGYYYPDNDIAEAKIQILRACQEHNSDQTAEKFKRLVFASMDPERLVDQFTRALQQALLDQRLGGPKNAIATSKLPVLPQVSSTKTLDKPENPKPIDPSSVSLKAIVTRKTSQTRLKSLANQNWGPLNLQFMPNGLCPESPEFQAIMKDQPLQEPKDGVKCLLLNTLECLLEFVHGGPEKQFLLLLEDDAIVCRNFYPRLEAAMQCWLEVYISVVLRVGYLPIWYDTVNDKNLVWPSGQLVIRTGFQQAKEKQDMVHFELQQKCIGNQGTLYSRKGAITFLQNLGIDFQTRKSIFKEPFSYGTLSQASQKLALKTCYGFESWSQFGATYVAPIDHLLDTPNLHCASIVEPLIIESEEGRTSSQCESMQSERIWRNAVNQGWSFEAF